MGGYNTARSGPGGEDSSLDAWEYGESREAMYRGYYGPANAAQVEDRTKRLRTVRCCYCCPRWTYGLRRVPVVGRLIKKLWPPHILGVDYGPPYTDRACVRAEKNLKAEERDFDLRLRWNTRWAEWKETADTLSIGKGGGGRAEWIRRYQAARRFYMLSVVAAGGE
ncbi:MAG: hypothetical protein RQ748_09890 [Elusimicrobiales bacterium]|nr:hypothetical protein [Elusimicrobiales bacterium]